MRLKIFSILISVAVTFTPATLNQAHAYNSMIEFENAMSDSPAPKTKDCTSQGKAYADLGDYSNVYIPGTISEASINALNSSANANAGGSIGGRAVGYTAGAVIGGAAAYAAISGTAAAALGPFAAILIAAMALALAIEGAVVEDLCNNVYVLQPHEYMNHTLGLVPQSNTSSVTNKNMECTYDSVGNTYANKTPGALTATQVPYYFTCDPAYDTINNTQVSATSGADALANIGKFWGYAGSGSTFCNDPAITGQALDDMKTHIGQISVIDTGNSAYRASAGRTRCNPWADSSGVGTVQYWLSAGTTANLRGTIELDGYYKFDTTEGKTYLCVAATRTLFPVRIGCTSVAPPTEVPQLDASILQYIAGTRCGYFLTGRSDLHALGASLTTDPDDQGHPLAPMKGFLMSDMHFTSTTVGCIKDMLIKVFISPVGIDNTTPQEPFFGRVQDSMRQIVFAVLVLYVTLIGIKIMSAAQQPSRGEYVMYVVKFALVVYFTTASAWYSLNGTQVTGLLPAILGAAEEFGDIFLQAQNSNDPVGYCSYRKDSLPILGQNQFPPGTNGTGTAGLSYVKMTIWDLIDCKIINYVNMGSCSYSLTGLFSVWFIGAAFWAGGSGFIFSIVCFVYTLMLMFILFRFAHIYIMSLFVLAVLVLISPIILCFALFEATKQIFQTWIKMVLGYMLYPALLMAFVALMLSTFDAAFYGTILQPGEQMEINTNPCTQTLADATGMNSAHCITYRNYMNTLGSAPCSASPSFLASSMIEEVDWKIIKFHVLQSQYIDMYMQALLKLMLFAVLFYFFLGSVAQFLEILVGVQSLSGLALGGMSALTPISKAGQAAGWVGGKGVSAVKGMAKDSKESKAKEASKSLGDDEKSE